MVSDVKSIEVMASTAYIFIIMYRINNIDMLYTLYQEQKSYNIITRIITRVIIVIKKLLS